MCIRDRSCVILSAASFCETVSGSAVFQSYRNRSISKRMFLANATTRSFQYGDLMASALIRYTTGNRPYVTVLVLSFRLCFSQFPATSTKRQHVVTRHSGCSVKLSLVGRVTGSLPKAIPLVKELSHSMGIRQKSRVGP